MRKKFLLYGRETWSLRAEDEMRIERNDRKMIRWIVGVRLADRISSAELRRRMNLEDIRVVMRTRRLRWFGHVERKDGEDWVRKYMNMEVDGKRPRGRPKKTW